MTHRIFVISYRSWVFSFQVMKFRKTLQAYFHSLMRQVTEEYYVAMTKGQCITMSNVLRTQIGFEEYYVAMNFI